MTNEVFFRHGRRFIAFLVGVMATIFIASLLILKQFRNVALYCITYQALISQGIFGNIMILLGFNVNMSIIYLINALFFFCLLVEAQSQLLNCSQIFIFKKRKSYSFKLIFFILFVQIFLGRILRHVGSGLIYVNSVLFCGVKKLRNSQLKLFHLLYRLFGCAIFVFDGLILLKTNNYKRENIQQASLLVLQLMIGFWIIFSIRSAYVVFTYTALAAAIFSSVYKNVRLLECESNYF